jgi:hypothetical protein
MDQNVLALGPYLLGVPSGVIKMSYEPMVLLAQSVHLSCTDTSTASKESEMTIHMTHVT